MFCLEYTGNEKWLARRSVYLVFLPALFFLAMAFLVPGSTASAGYHFGIEAFVERDLLKWGFYSYLVILILVNLGVLFTCFTARPAFWAPILLISLGRIVPMIGFIFLDSARMTVLPIQATILFAGVSMLAYFVALYNYGMLRVMPVARDMVIARMPYSLIVLDAEHRLVDFNPAARTLPNLGELALHQTASRALGDWWEKISPLIGSEPVSKDVPVRSGSTELIFRVMSLPLLQASGWRIGQVFLFEDVTQARHAQRQQAQALWAQATFEERSQLANELHDGISQSLAFLNLQSQAAQIYLQTGQSQAALDSLLRLSEAAGEIQAETRELIGSLLSVSLPAENFCKSLRQIVADFEQQTGLAVHLQIEIDPLMGRDMTLETLCDPASLSPLIAVQLIRITQEALANVRKHAQGASQVSMRLNAWDGQLWLTICDDGAGFVPADPKIDGKHFGLQVMQQRAARLGGQVAIHSAPGKGTQIEVRLPLEAPLLEKVTSE